MNAARDLLLSNMPILQLLPAASEDEMQAVAIALDSPIPNELSEILKTTTGFTDSKRGAVRFTGHFGFEFRELFPHALPILPDGFGNFWVLDVDSNNQKLGGVFLVSHDPAVIVVQARTLAEFLSQIINQTNDAVDAIDFVRKRAVYEIWRSDPWLMNISEALSFQDIQLSNFVKSLPVDFRIADLRSLNFGSGFSWGKAGPNTPAVRARNLPIFAVGTGL